MKSWTSCVICGDRAPEDEPLNAPDGSSPACVSCASPLERAVMVRLGDVAPERVSWLWRGRLPRGKLVVLDGDPDKGKSTLSLDLAARISTGSPMPDGDPLDGPAAVVIMSAEDGIADTIRPRLDAAGADVSRIVAFTEVVLPDGTTRTPSLPYDLAHVETAVMAEGAALVIVDVLNAYLGADVNGYRDQDVRRALHPLSKMAERTGACVMALRHLTKGSGGANAVYRGGGSIGIIGAARVGLVAAVDPEDDTRRVLAVSKCNLAERATALAYRLVADELRDVARVQWEGPTEHTADGLLVLRDEREHAGDDDALDAVDALGDVLADGPVWVKEVFDAMRAAGFSRDQSKRAKSKLKARSVKVGKPGDAEQGWQWELPGSARRVHEASEGSHVPTCTPFAPLGDESLPSETWDDLEQPASPQPVLTARHGDVF